MRRRSNTCDNLLTPPVYASDNQAEAGPSTSRHLVGQAQLPQVTTNQSDAGPSITRQVAIAEPQIPDISTGSPLSSSHKRQLTREEIQRKINKYSTRLREYARHGTDDIKGKQKAHIDSTQKANQKMVSHMQKRILEQMLIIMERCNAKGFVNESVHGGKGKLYMFHQYYKDNLLSSNVSQDI